MSTITLVLAEDHRLVRSAIAVALELQPDFEVLAVASDGVRAVELTLEHRPDVVLMDLCMPTLNGIDAAVKILRERPEQRIIALSQYGDQKSVQTMQRLGAKGYVLKATPLEQLIKAIRVVHSGKLYASPSLLDPAAEPPDGASPWSMEDPFGLSQLSPREREVIQLIAEGWTTREIATHLNISPRTVDHHRARLLRKLGLDNVADLTKWAIRNGLTSI